MNLDMIPIKKIDWPIASDDDRIVGLTSDGRHLIRCPVLAETASIWTTSTGDESDAHEYVPWFPVPDLYLLPFPMFPYLARGPRPFSRSGNQDYGALIGDATEAGPLCPIHIDSERRLYAQTAIGTVYGTPNPGAVQDITSAFIGAAEDATSDDQFNTACAVLTEQTEFGPSLITSRNLRKFATDEFFYHPYAKIPAQFQTIVESNPPFPTEGIYDPNTGERFVIEIAAVSAGLERYETESQIGPECASVGSGYTSGTLPMGAIGMTFYTSWNFVQYLESVGFAGESGVIEAQEINATFPILDFTVTRFVDIYTETFLNSIDAAISSTIGSMGWAAMSATSDAAYDAQYGGRDDCPADNPLLSIPNAYRSKLAPRAYLIDKASSSGPVVNDRYAVAVQLPDTNVYDHSLHGIAPTVHFYVRPE